MVCTLCVYMMCGVWYVLCMCVVCACVMCVCVVWCVLLRSVCLCVEVGIVFRSNYIDEDDVSF